LENKTDNESIIKIIIEDEKDNINNIVKDIKEIKKLEFIKQNEDGTKEYNITLEDKKDIRKELFSKCASQDVTILELTKIEKTLEDAFMKLIDNEEEEEEE
jgi:hypothetical protein